MIVLDEQLLGRNIEVEIARWYRGTVCFITDLRPNTIIKDDAIPQLLRRHNQPTFVTINASDFWNVVDADEHFCVVCFELPDSQAREISARLRALLGQQRFATKNARMGKIIRVTLGQISYYAVDERKVQRVRF
jgi:hypothetical protein